jgi:tetratricopeptide (TPR) repeat protein
MGVHLERALMLYEQSRFDLAEREVRTDLEGEPENATAHALLALCQAERGEVREATWSAQEAVTREPDLPFAHYALASVLQDRERLDEAQQSILEAIRLDPKNTNYLAQLASIRCDQGRWQDAMEATEQGLRLDPEHIACINLRALALNKLGRAAESRAAIESALARDPLNAVTHANLGWACLQKGEADKALEHFREALRLDSEFAMARHGIVECLKTRYAVYRFLLRFMLWMAGLSKPWQWGIILGGAAAYLILLFILLFTVDLDDSSWWGRLIWPLLISYLAFGVMTWIADPLFNLLLRFDRFGRLALSSGQRTASTWVGACLAFAFIFMMAALFTGSHALWAASALSGLLVIPITGVFNCPPGPSRRLMVYYTLAIILCGVVGILLLPAMPAEREDVNLAFVLRMILALFFLGAGVLATFLSGGLVLMLLNRNPRNR